MPIIFAILDAESGRKELSHLARPRKCRRVCDYPRTLAFSPEESGACQPPVILTVDEYEAIRLIDKEGLSQEQCGEQMQVARTTVQQIYASARKKLADVLVDGLPLRIEGGDVTLCGGGNPGCSGCYKQKIMEQYAKSKGETIMRIAVTYENGEIFQHFGHTEQFGLYDVEDGQIVSSEVVDTAGSGHGALAGMLSALHVDALICGGIGVGAQQALAAAGIRLYAGVTGSADAAAQALAEGKLACNANATCSHHGEHHEGSCGSHGCGHHSCGEK